jgi:hypothetical protein
MYGRASSNGSFSPSDSRFAESVCTFSTFEYETARLVEERHLVMALLNVLLSVTVGFVAVWGGIVAARQLEGLPALSDAAYMKFEQRADESDPHQSLGAERDIRDATIKRG